MEATESNNVYVSWATGNVAAHGLCDDKNQKAKYNVSRMRSNLEHFDDSLNFFGKLCWKFLSFL